MTSIQKMTPEEIIVWAQKQAELERATDDELNGADFGVAAARAMVFDRIATVIEAQQARIDELESFLHSRLMHPNYEYETTTGQRKAFDEDPPYEDPNSWERNTDYGDNGWARFEYHEEAYWRRRKALAACKEECPKCHGLGKIAVGDPAETIDCYECACKEGE